MKEVIDLLDCEDEEPKAPAPKYTYTPAQSMCDNDDDDEVEFVKVQQPAAASLISAHSETVAERKTFTAIKTPRNAYKARPPRVSFEAASRVDRPKNPYNQTPRVVSQLSQNGCDSDSSNDSLMNAGPVFSKPASSAVASTNPTRTDFALAEIMMRRPPTDDSLMNGGPISSSEKRATSAVMVPPPLKPTPSYTPTNQVVHDPPFQYPTLLSNSKQYEDLRPNYILAFWCYARKRTQHSYDRPKLDQLANKIVLLAMTPHPIRSLEEYCFGRGLGGGSGATAADKAKREHVLDQLLQGGLEIRILRMTPAHEPKKYTSIAEACLVALLNEIQSRLGKKMWILES